MLFQKINQICHDDLSDDACDETETPDDVAQPCRKCPDEEKECLTDIQLETSKQPTREEVIHYVVPLSPIQEESWSEFSELERAAEMDKTDVSTSLSMHPVDEICDTVNATLVNQIDKKTKNPAEDEDSDASNRTFILCEDVVDNHNLNRKYVFFIM